MSVSRLAVHGGPKVVSAPPEPTPPLNSAELKAELGQLIDEGVFSDASDAGVTELYRSAEPVPGLGAGPHELSLTRVSSSPGTPAPPMHQRSAAALYMLLSGTGVLHMPDRDERREAGAVVYEPNGFIHTWENVGTVPLVLLQANISREGVPEILWSR